MGYFDINMGYTDGNMGSYGIIWDINGIYLGKL